MDISAEQVKKLRNETGAPVMDVRRALIEAKGNTASAKEILKAFKKAKTKSFWTAFLNPKFLDQELINLIKDLVSESRCLIPVSRRSFNSCSILSTFDVVIMSIRFY